MSFGGFDSLKRNLCVQKRVSNLAGPPGFPLDPGGHMQASKTLVYKWCEQKHISKVVLDSLGGPPMGPGEPTYASKALVFILEK